MNAFDKFINTGTQLLSRLMVLQAALAAVNELAAIGGARFDIVRRDISRDSGQTVSKDNPETVSAESDQTVSEDGS